MDIYIEQTTNPNIIRFVAPEVITEKSLEFSSEDDKKTSPLASKLFQFPFVEKIIISTNMIAIQKNESISWEDVANDIKIIINEFYQNNQIYIESVNNQASEAFSLYVEMTPNPNAMKFVANKFLIDELVEYKSVDDAKAGSLAHSIFQFPFVKEILISKNYISIVKTDQVDWNDVAMGVREHILNYLMTAKPILNEAEIVERVNKQNLKTEFSDIEKEIKIILDSNIKPAVANDGGNIELVEYRDDSKTAVMLLQGACSGCPSSSATLKNGIEHMLKEMMPGVVEKVEALNS